MKILHQIIVVNVIIIKLKFKMIIYLIFLILIFSISIYATIKSWIYSIKQGYSKLV